ncbi:DUF2750 domain-containing protein [Macrococcoides caseolyticum]|nr:DUF2750 domain-containing protein [Macrococcus caseolyticus]RKO16120.1 DUF2750 domain-containing protein [Macrococcus caseolyticus]
MMNINFNFSLQSLSKNEVDEYFKKIKYELPEEYISIFYDGNKFNTRGWYFFPVKDFNNLKKTAVDIIEINKRINDEEFFIIAENKDDAYLALSKDVKDVSLYIIDAEENTVNFLANNFEEFLHRIMQRFPEKSVEDKVIKDYKMKLKNSEYIYFIYDPENDFTVFVQSMEYYPSAVGLFWLDEDRVKLVRDKQFPELNIKKIKVNEFKIVYLSILDEEQQLLGLDWDIQDDGLEIFPDALM